MTYADMHQRLPSQDVERPRKSALARVLSWLIGWTLIAGILTFAVGGWAWMSFKATGPLQQNAIVNIEKGLNRSEIAYLLKSKGVISDARIFSAVTAVNTLRSRFLKPGEYEFTPGSSMQDVMAMLQQGRVLTYKITIPEGLTTELALQRIRDNTVLIGDITSVPVEGALLANTLVFQRSTTRQELVDDLIAQQGALLDEIWGLRQADTPLKSKQELLTLASIVEKETGKPEERPAVAAVFLNRLRKGMRLQSDPTIIYGLVGGKGKLDRPLTKADIEGATPYNTYVIDRLPPGPIATPGRASLEAVVRPDISEYLYFVADGTGGHSFARTLEEHDANVAKWRKIENANVDQPAPAANLATKAEAESKGVMAAVPLEDPVPETPAPAAEDQRETAALPQPTGTTVPETPAVSETSLPDNAPVLDLEPGSVIKVGGKMVPVPAPRALKQ